VGNRALGSILLAAGSISCALGACSTPEDPIIPPPPGDDAGTADVLALPVETCVGSPEGSPCAGGKICVSGACLDPSCGDGIVTPPEECDRGAGNQPGSGCEPTCKFTCSDADPGRGCPSANPCIGAGTCDPQLHTCKPGAPLAEGASCGTNKMCAGGRCIDAVCGDGVVTPPEQCDNGNANGAGRGCETSCKFSCSNPATDCPAVPCNTSVCTAQHVCGTTPDATKNGQPCGGIAGYTCSNGACLAPGAVCGNGVVEGGEECDFGAGNGPGTGCESNCKFSCATAANCVDPNACHNPPTCDPVTVNGKQGKKCNLGSTKADGSVCGTGSICLGGMCKTSVCGDGWRDDAKGEQCDDANTTNLDGCDATCKFEQDQRVVGMQMQFGTDAFCNNVNALGGAIAGPAQGTLQSSINEGIADGSLSAMFKFVGDPTGTSGAVTAGSLSGAPVAGAGYNGNSDLDWWYTVDPNSIDGTRTALASVTGTYSGGSVSLAGTLNLVMSIGGSLAVLHVTSAKITSSIGTPATTPTASSGGTPGHLASEHLLPSLTSFPTMGGARTSPAAKMCGNVSANSLANTAVPATLLPGGGTPCTEAYTTNNRAIDVFVNGCHVKVFGIPVTAIKPTQPDQIDPAATPAGAGGPYTLSVDATTKRVNQCKDKNGAVVNLTACLNAAAYSSFFKFATDRVIVK
jgi:cysteine-rich repeat protein